jgi:hypothetical protein
MLEDIERVAASSGLHLVSRGGDWAYSEDSPHITRFHYDLASYGSDERLVPRGTADGYRITHDWSIGSAPQIWDEADALDGDVVRYVEALIRETRACEVVFDFAADVTTAQRITILRHVAAAKGVDSAELTYHVAACLAMMDAPVLMLVDPWPMSDERHSAKGKLKGRGHFPKLLELGFVRMVGSRFLWAWNRELSDSLMDGYSYEKLVRARRSGKLGEVLKTPISEEIYGKLPVGVAEMIDLPEPDDLTSE